MKNACVVLVSEESKQKCFNTGKTSDNTIELLKKSSAKYPSQY